MRLQPNVLLLLLALSFAGKSFGQDGDLLNLVSQDKPKKEPVYGAFKSSRVIMSHSMEMLRPGVLDFRILHRFGMISGGAYQFFGLDGPATIRLGLDYGISDNLSIGIGRSTVNKELDGFIKYRPIQQAKGPAALPFSLVVALGSTLNTLKDPVKLDLFSARLAYYTQVILGRKFSDRLSLQVMPIYLHRNQVDSGNRNNTFNPGIGGRIKLSKRVSLNVDYYYIIHKDIHQIPPFTSYRNPLSIGFDIETGGHVFQLHFTNSKGLNERAFLTGTEENWGKGDIFFGFNISRSFQVKKKKG